MNTKMKTLSMAVLGLVGFAAAGAAMAQCPTTLNPPWSAVSVTGTGSTAASVTGGYDSTACKLRTSIGQATNANAKAIVVDGTPASEARYRAQFIIDPSALSASTNLRTAIAFNVTGATVPAGLTGNMVQVFLRSTAAGKALQMFVGDTAAGGGSQVVAPFNLPVQAGPNRFEIDLTVANGTGQLKYWVSDATAAAPAEGSPTGTVSNLTNIGWTGVDQITLGLGGANANWRANYTGTDYVYFDQFDSRRQTYIGH